MPAAESLQAGDFLWPKVPGKIVPYDSAAGVASDAERKEYEKDRRAELSRLALLEHPTQEEKERYSTLSTLDYTNFTASYLSGRSAGTVEEYGAIGPIATGHVAIVTVKDGTPWIIEAMLKEGVRELSYSDWLRSRPGEVVWHGRLKDSSPEQRASVATFAAGELGKPYKFWNFNLADEAGFYCSKLAWLSVYRTLGTSLDGNVNPQRSIWYSPKQMQHSGLIEMISSPGAY